MASAAVHPFLSVDALRGEVRGEVIGPNDPGYDAARTVVPGGIDRHPAVIIRVADDGDVARAIALARDTGLELAIRSGAHSAAGHSTTEGGILIDLAKMNSLEIDADARTAWAEAGLSAGEVSSAAAARGLAIGFGDTGSVGIGGITLGGGVGYLSRKFGLTIDSLLAADLVTAEGQVLRVDAESNPDLFWAIRGGGGNFGVATRFQYRLEELGPVTGGMLLLPATEETVVGFIAEADAAPDELTTIANVMPVPPMPFVPEEHHGKLAIMALMIHADGGDAGQQGVAPFRALAEPMVDQLRPMAYSEIYGPEDPDYHPLAVAKNMFIDHVDAACARTIIQFLNASDAPLRAAQLRVLGGAVARVPADATAYAHRSSKIMVNLAAFHDGTDEDLARRQGWVDDFMAAIDQGERGAYVNFLADEGPDRVRAAYPDGTWERLVDIKRRYDPGNLFRLNQNIPPA